MSLNCGNVKLCPKLYPPFKMTAVTKNRNFLYYFLQLFLKFKMNIHLNCYCITISCFTFCDFLWKFSFSGFILIMQKISFKPSGDTYCFHPICQFIHPSQKCNSSSYILNGNSSNIFRIAYYHMKICIALRQLDNNTFY